jgi:hypothetical protein
VKVAFSDRALAELRRIDASWRKRASSPDVFLEELQETIKLVETAEVLGSVYDAKTKRRVHRLLMETSE